MPWGQEVQQLFRAPVGMRLAGGTQQLCNVEPDAVRAGVGGATPIAQPRSSFSLETGEPLIANSPADPGVLAELGHVEFAR